MNADVRPTDDGRRPDSPVRRIDAACDRFEAAWRAGGEPRIEDVLAGAPAADRPALLRELLALEVELRRGRGERATPADYRGRFRGYGDVINAAFAEADTEPADGTPRPGRSLADTGRNLLFGMLALQNNFVGRDALLSAFAAWVADRSRPLGRILRDAGVLDDARHALLEALVAEHLKLHGDDPERSLAALSSIGSVRDDLERIDDADLQASLAATASRLAGADGDAGAAGSASSSRRAGERFRILRFHREGGLGRVYVARDDELGRQVALKEIRPDKATEADLRGRFVLEAEITGGLEHPGIVPVYGLGTYQDGRPFYAMRFVEGDSLKEAIEAYHREHPRPDPSAVEFRRLLGRFVDVCEAIAFAHSKGVLHRDLKPHNVMLGRYGETLLIDWGLAKATGRREPSRAEAAVEATLVPPSGSGHAPTIGVLGSPPYMSPEQAAGAMESLGPATDIYGLGAVLFALLTGEAPVEGDTTEQVLDRARRGAIRSPRSLNPNLPWSLEAVCLKALATAPEGRYPTALALAEDIEHWLADEPVAAWREPLTVRTRRWLRRHRTAAAAAVAAVVVALAGTVAVLVIQTRANRDLQAANERERARFNLAMDAVKLFHGEVSEDLLLKEKQFEGLRTKLLRGAADFYNKLEDLLQGRTDRASRGELGRAYAELGELTDQIGSKAEALAVHRKALAVRRQLAGERGTGPAAREDVARSLLAVGLLQQAIGDPAGALASCEEARKRLEDLEATLNAADPLQEVVALSHQRIGQLLFATGKPVEALASYERAIPILQDLTEAHPSVVQYQSDLGSTYLSIGVLLTETGRRTEALPAFERARQILRELAEAHPSGARFQSELARALDKFGLLMRHMDRPTEALAAYERARAILQSLVDARPNIAQFRRELAAAARNIGMLLQAEKPAESLAAFEQAMAILQELVQAHATVTEFPREMALNLGYVAALRQKAGRLAEAVVSRRQAITIYEQLPSRTPHELYNLACDHAALSGLAAQPASGVTAAQGQAEAGRAMEWLRRAVAAGYRHVGYMRIDTDLDPLRSRLDFQLLMMDLSMPEDPFAR